MDNQGYQEIERRRELTDKALEFLNATGGRGPEWQAFEAMLELSAGVRQDVPVELSRCAGMSEDDVVRWQEWHSPVPRRRAKRGSNVSSTGWACERQR
jgi:hypothetical protein